MFGKVRHLWKVIFLLHYNNGQLQTTC
jgi:hypothetical protein